MDEDGRKYPSLPSNYVTLVQLQERWLKEQQRKQGEKEEEERKQREKEDQEKQKGRNKNGERSKVNTVPRLPFRRDRRNRSEKSFRTIGVSERKPEELQVGAIVVDDGERKIDGPKKEKQKKREPRAGKNRTGVREQLVPEIKAEEKIPEVVTEGKREKEVSAYEIRRKGKNIVVNCKVSEREVRVDRSAEMGRKFQDLSVSGAKGGNRRSYGTVDGVQWNYDGGSGMFNRRKLQTPRAPNMVWVRKGDASEANVS